MEVRLRTGAFGLALGGLGRDDLAGATPPAATRMVKIFAADFSAIHEVLPIVGTNAVSAPVRGCDMATFDLPAI
jgi:hypothetical protein